MIQRNDYDISSRPILRVIPGAPLRASVERLSDYDNLVTPRYDICEVEFLLVLKGQMTCRVAGRQALLKEGWGAFINARQPRFLRAEDGDCMFIKLTIDSSFLSLNAHTRESDVDPYVGNAAFRGVVLSPDGAWQSGVLGDIRLVYDCVNEREMPAVTCARCAVFSMWAQLRAHAPGVRPSSVSTARQRTAINVMLDYVSANFDRQISISDVANAGGADMDYCAMLFKKTVGLTPLMYLTNYRLDRSLHLLRFTKMNIDKVAGAVGIKAPGYFARLFKDRYGVSPHKFRLIARET